MTDWTEELVESDVYHQWAPERPWQAAQREREVLFMHYEVDADAVRALLPPALELQRCGGSAWVGIVTLEMEDVRLRRFRLPAPWGRFPEVDFMTYVSYEGRRGIYFFSIESARRVAASLVRWTTAVPYLYSGLQIEKHDHVVRVTSGPRVSQGAATAVLDLSYEPRPQEPPVDPGSPIAALLDQFSTFVIDWRGRVRELDEVHAPWQPMEADVDVRVNTLGAAIGLDLPLAPTLVHHTKSRYILSWWPQVVRPGRPGLAPTAPRL